MYGDLGFDFFDTVKSVGRDAVTAAKNVVLAKAGNAVASTPEGQAAIKQSLLQRGAEQVSSAFDQARPFLPIIGLGVALFILSRRRR